ncbi:hypothetical protein N0V84_000364 [Fusarium piperis]|uniref:Uncharacterized protein n=1 Tax=Fusarium piperis TaxID=1435070 RepID=A0A9W9BU41_9HYPO|nr:hypothetical protein N0V84_000364 [Fusarium piperis]
MKHTASTDDSITSVAHVLESTCEEASSEKEAFEDFNTNVFGTVKLCRAVITYLRAQYRGGIADLGSLGSWVGSLATSFYNVTKWDVSGFMGALAAGLEPFSIVVTSVAGRFPFDWCSGMTA